MLRTNPEVAVVYIKAAVTLHNFGIERREILETQQNVVQQVANVDPRPTDGSLLDYWQITSYKVS